jgi:hypothetical protein
MIQFPEEPASEASIQRKRLPANLKRVPGPGDLGMTGEADFRASVGQIGIRVPGRAQNSRVFRRPVPSISGDKGNSLSRHNIGDAQITVIG